MCEFEIINSRIKELKHELEEYATKLEFQTKCEFTLENCETYIPWNEIKGKGVYLIEIKNDNSLKISIRGSKTLG